MNKYKPSHAQIRLLEACIQMEAYIETIKPEIRAIYNDVLFYMFPENKLKDKYTGESITDYNQLYRYEGDCSEYYAETERRLIEAGFKPSKPGFCPLLESEHLLRVLQHKFVAACCDTLENTIDGLTYDQLANSPLDIYHKFLDINTRYVIQFIDTNKLIRSI